MAKTNSHLWLTPLFLILAVVFLVGSNLTPEIAQDSKEKTSPFISTKYVRDPVTEASFLKNNLKYECNSCHRNIEDKGTGLGGKGKELVGEHIKIKLEHGANDRCLNCHHVKNREAFINHDGSEIPFQNSIDLCRKCHGPKYRDWELGIHGRPTGFWDSKKGVSTKGVCNQCHDPHSPKFKAIQPFAGPQEMQKETQKEGHK